MVVLPPKILFCNWLHSPLLIFSANFVNLLLHCENELLHHKRLETSLHPDRLIFARPAQVRVTGTIGPCTSHHPIWRRSVENYDESENSVERTICATGLWDASAVFLHGVESPEYKSIECNSRESIVCPVIILGDIVHGVCDLEGLRSFWKRSCGRETAPLK